ncbi:MAG: hypothetical protein ACR2MS_01180 [Weeksellaceae bacterium]
MDKWKKNIKQSLEHREIEPSGNSWNKLEGMLNEHDAPTKSNRKWTWFSIAASLMFLISIGVFFLLSDKDGQQQPIAIQPDVQKTNNKKETLAPNIHDTNIQKKDSRDHLMKEEIANLNLNINSETSENSQKKNSNRITSQQNMDSTNLAIITPILNKDTTSKLNVQSTEDYLAAAMRKLKEDSLNSSTLYVSDKTLLNQVEDEVFEEKSPDLLNRITDQIKALQAAISKRNKEQ